QRQPLAGDGVDIARGVADQRHALSDPRAHLAPERAGAARFRLCGRAVEPRGQGREARQQCFEAGAIFERAFVPEEGDVDAGGADRRDVGLGAALPVDLDEGGPARQREMTTQSEAPTRATNVAVQATPTARTNASDCATTS